MNTNKLVISSVNNFVQLLRRHPGLTQLAAFAGVVNVVQQAIKTIDPKCTKCKAKKIINSNREIFESALTHLQPFEKNQIKVITGATEICYYVKRNNKLDIVCF